MRLGASAAATILSSCAAIDAAQHSGPSLKRSKRGSSRARMAFDSSIARWGLGVSSRSISTAGRPEGYSLDALAAGRTLIAWGHPRIHVFAGIAVPFVCPVISHPRLRHRCCSGRNHVIEHS